MLLSNRMMRLNFPNKNENIELPGGTILGRRIVDLSIAIEPELPSDPSMMIPQVAYVDHAAGAEQMEEFFP